MGGEQQRQAKSATGEPATQRGSSATRFDPPGPAPATEPLPDSVAAALWAGIRAETVGAKETVGQRLKALPVLARMGIVWGMALVIASIVALIMGFRPEVQGAAAVRYALGMTGLVVLAGTLFYASLRGLHRPAMGKVAWFGIGLALVLPAVLAAWPSLWTGSVEAAHLETGYGCTVLGLVTGAVVSLTAFALQRSTSPAPFRVLSALAGGGVIAFGLLELHCPSRDPAHLVLGHASVVLALVGLGWAGAAMWRAR